MLCALGQLVGGAIQITVVIVIVIVTVLCSMHNVRGLLALTLLLNVCNIHCASIQTENIVKSHCTSQQNNYQRNGYTHSDSMAIRAESPT